MKISNIFKRLAEARDNFSFWLQKGATYGPSKPVREEMAKNGWTFRSELVVMPGAPAVAESYHPILNGVEIREKTPEWDRYERERIAAVYKVFNRPQPGAAPAPGGPQ